MSVTTMSATDAEAKAGQPKKKGRKKKVIVLAVVLAVAGAAAWWFLLRPPAGEQKPEPGEVMALQPIQVNLAGGHYLKIGLALQASADATELDGSKALDSAIQLFSGLHVEDLIKPAQREHLKEKLLDSLDDRYDGEVLDVYFTDFVTQ